MAGYVNKRAKDMWEFISGEVNFSGKTVLDVGCGPGDFMRLALASGAKGVHGIDKDFMIVSDASSALMGDGREPGEDFWLYVDDIDFMVHGMQTPHYVDISICFSCLPYLFNIDNTIRWMQRQTSYVSLIECQYKGDGPYAPEHITNDDDMRAILNGHWKRVKKIGETKLNIRPATRSIWACYYE